jgi:predicted nucleic-acid-binding protein
MRPENRRMHQFLKENEIKANVKYISKGSLKNTWRLYNKGQKWSQELIDSLTALNFTDFDGSPLNLYSGNGGIFSVFVRGHYELSENGKSD